MIFFVSGLLAPSPTAAVIAWDSVLAVDDSGHVYLADALQSTVFVFDRATGALAATITGTARLRLPSDVTLGADGSVFVTSNLGAEIVRLSGPEAGR